MAKITWHEDERIHIVGRFMRESLVDRGVIASTTTEEELRILPDFDLIGIGGQSVFDRGRAALFPLVDEIAELHRTRRLVLGVGGEVLGLRRLVLLKDVDGLYTKDPNKHPDARRIPVASARDVLAMDLPELVVDQQLLVALSRARNVEEVVIANALVPGTLSRV